MATPIFPPELPIVSTFRLRPDSRLLTDESDQGPRDARRISDVPAADADVEWIFIEQDLATFLEFRKTDLKNGHKRFCIELPSAGGITCHIVRLLSTRVRVTGHGSWTVSAALEIRERAFEIETCPPSDECEPFDNLVFMDVFTDAAETPIYEHTADIRPALTWSYDDLAFDPVITADGTLSHPTLDTTIYAAQLTGPMVAMQGDSFRMEMAVVYHTETFSSVSAWFAAYNAAMSVAYKLLFEVGEGSGFSLEIGESEIAFFPLNSLPVGEEISIVLLVEPVEGRITVSGSHLDAPGTTTELTLPALTNVGLIELMVQGSSNESTDIAISSAALADMHVCPSEPGEMYIGWAEPYDQFNASNTAIENAGSLSNQLFPNFIIFAGLVDNPGSGGDFVVNAVWEPVTPGDPQPFVYYGPDEVMFGYIQVQVVPVLDEEFFFDHNAFGVLNLTATWNGTPVRGRLELAISMGVDGASYANLEWNWYDTEDVG